MKLQPLTLGFCFVLLSNVLFATQPEDSVSMLRDLFEPDSATNLTISAYRECPLRYTNVISNMNLFTSVEEILLKEVSIKYKNVTTNLGPTASVMVSISKTNDCTVSHFIYPETGASEDIFFGKNALGLPHDRKYNDFLSNLGSSLLARFRTKGGNGYDVVIPSDRQGVLIFAQIKGEEVNGQFIIFQRQNCQQLLNFANGKAIGKWLLWGDSENNYLLEIQIRSPLDYFYYMTQGIKD